MRSASGKCRSTSACIWWAKSSLVRRSVTSTWRQPPRGWTNRNRLAIPLRAYSVSNRSGWPGSMGSGMRVSATNCLLDSSKPTTGRAGSYGSAYRSRRASIRQTNSAPTVGITHSFLSQGLSWFFEQPPNGFIGNVGEHLQLDQAVGQELHRPAQPSLRRLGAGQRDRERLLFGSQLRRRAGALALGERRFQSLLDEPLPGARHRSSSGRQSRGDL